MNTVIPQPVNQAQVETITTPESLRAISLRLLEQVKSLKHDLKLISEQKTSIMNANGEVQQANAAAEPYTKAVTSAKKKVKEQMDFKQLATKEKDTKKELKEISTTLTNHLVNYTHLTGVNVIEDDDGREMKIKHAVSVLSGQMRLL